MTVCSLFVEESLPNPCILLIFRYRKEGLCLTVLSLEAEVCALTASFLFR